MKTEEKAALGQTAGIIAQRWALEEIKRELQHPETQVLIAFLETGAGKGCATPGCPVTNRLKAINARLAPRKTRAKRKRKVKRRRASWKKASVGLSISEFLDQKSET